MRKVVYLLYGVFLSFVLINVSYAASFGLSANKTSVVVGNTFTVTVNVSGAAGWEYCLNYDNSLFTLTNAPTDTGNQCVRTGSTLIGYGKVTFTFKANKSGSGTFSLSGAAAYDDNGIMLDSSKGSVTVRARTQAEIEASYSTNDYLKEITVDGYEITPTFNKDTLEYELEVENDIEKVNVNAVKEDSRATLKNPGEVELTEGLNKVEIVVTAEKGNKRTYVLNITRKELNPINVSVGGKNLTVVRKEDSLEVPTYYTKSTVMINDIEVPAMSSEITGYKLVGLKDEDGEIALYIYDNNEFTLYNQIGMDSFVFIPLSVVDKVTGYDNTREVSIGDLKVTGYYKDDAESEFVLVYGMNAKTGESAWYQYDLKQETFQRFQSKEIIKLQDDLNDYFLLVVCFATGLGLSILTIIFLLINNSKVKKKNIKMVQVLRDGEVIEKEFLVEEVNNEDDESKKEVKDEENSLDEEKKESKEAEEEVLETISVEVEEKDEVGDIKEQEIDEDSLSGREKRKKEKRKKKEKEQELLQAQQEFLSDTTTMKSFDTYEVPVVEDKEVLEEEVKPKKRGRKKKQKNEE